MKFLGQSQYNNRLYYPIRQCCGTEGKIVTIRLENLKTGLDGLVVLHVLLLCLVVGGDLISIYWGPPHIFLLLSFIANHLLCC